MTERHEPTPEFRAFLESEIARAMRRGRRPGLLERTRGLRVRTLLPIAIALLLGVAVGAMPGRIQEAKDRKSLAALAKMEEQLAAMRLELARSAYEEAKRKFEVGVLGKTSLVAAEAELRAMEAKLARIRVNEEEIQATAAPPRDEISAPVVGSRDFVSERLRLDLMAAQQRLSSVEAAAGEAQRRVDVGTASRVALLEAQAELSRAESDLRRIASALDLRKEVISRSIPPADAERRLQRLELMSEADVARTLHQLAEERVSNLRRMYEIGRADQLELKRAEVEVLERRAEMEAIARRLQLLDR